MAKVEKKKKSSVLAKVLSATKKIREEAEEKRNNQFEKVDWFYPKEGISKIRILPNPKDGEELFYKQVTTHFMPIKTKKGKQVAIPVRCLQDLEETCPFCEAWDKLGKHEDDDKREAASRTYRPSTRYLMNILNLDDRKVQPYAMQQSIFEEIAGWLEEFGTEIWSIDAGRDFKIIRKNKNGRTEYAVRPSLADSEIPEKLRPLLEAAIDLESLFTENRGEDMTKYLEANDVELDEEPKKKKKKSAKVEEDEDEEEVEEDEEDADDDDADSDEDDSDSDEEESDEDDEESDDEDDADDEDDEEEDDDSDADDEDEDEDADDEDEDADDDSDDDEEEEDEDDEEEEEKPKSKSKPGKSAVKSARERAEAAKKKSKPEVKKSLKKAKKNSTSTIRT